MNRIAIFLKKSVFFLVIAKKREKQMKKFVFFAIVVDIFFGLCYNDRKSECADEALCDQTRKRRKKEI